MHAANAANAPVAAQAQPSIAMDILGIVLPLLFVIAALLVVLRLLRKRYGLTGSDAPLAVVQIVPVGPRERVVLLRTRAGKVLAVGVAAQSVNLLAELQEADIGPLKNAAQPATPPASPLTEQVARWRDRFAFKRG